ncbi:hypothetical protein Peur_069419 [Populus x canadensis]
MSKTNNNMALMNQRIDRMTNEFGDSLDRLEKQRVKDYSRVQIKLELREFNVRRAIRRVNINVDEFVTDNMDMSDVDFEDVSV